MKFRYSVCKTLCEVEIGKIQDEFRRMYHNGSIDLPDIDDDEWENFWDRLSNNVYWWAEDLERDISDMFEITFKIYQRGRSGATFYPDGYKTHIGSDEISVEDIYGQDPDWYSEEEWPDAYKHCKRFAEALKFFNDTVIETAACIPEWWKEETEYMKEEAA